MRLVTTPGRPRPTPRNDAFEQLRDAGLRLEHVVARYGRLVDQFSEGRSTPDFGDSVTLLNNQVGYVARRLQELIVVEYERRQAEGGEQYSRAAV